ncbi:MAG: hypothetical protein WBP96_10205, partial [Nitrososphaeraceae archaeon]
LQLPVNHQHSCSRQYFFGVYKKALLFEIKLLPNIKNKRKKKDYLPYHFRMVYKNNKCRDREVSHKG